jgi:hypothetical protein
VGSDILCLLEYETDLAPYINTCTPHVKRAFASRGACPLGRREPCEPGGQKPRHEGCAVYPASRLEEVLECFRGKSVLPNALQEKISFESVIDKPIDFGRIRGQEQAKRAAVISAAGGYNLLTVCAV